MFLKFKALGILAGFTAAAFAFFSTIQWLASVYGSDAVVKGISFCFIGGLFYMMYSLILGKLQYDQRVDELNKSNEPK